MIKLCNEHEFEIVISQPFTSNPLPSAIEIIAITAEACEFTSADLTGLSQKRLVTECRYIAMAIIKRLYPKMSLKAIGYKFNRDHSTVIYGIDTCEDLYHNNKAFRAKAILVNNAINSKINSHDH